MGNAGIYVFCNNSDFRNQITDEIYASKETADFYEVVANIRDKFGCDIEVRNFENVKYLYCYV